MYTVNRVESLMLCCIEGSVVHIFVVLIAMVIIFKQQITALVQTIWTTINKDAKKVYS